MGVNYLKPNIWVKLTPKSGATYPRRSAADDGELEHGAMNQES